MSNKGKRKYKCEECGTERLVHWVELNRAARIRCQRCGSPRIEPVTKDGKDDILYGNLNVAEADPLRGDIMPAEPSPANRVRKRL